MANNVATFDLNSLVTPIYQLISMRYEKGSIILTSNYSFKDWGEVFQDNVVAGASIDRIVHHTKIFYINCKL